MNSEQRKQWLFDNNIFKSIENYYNLHSHQLDKNDILDSLLV